MPISPEVAHQRAIIANASLAGDAERANAARTELRTLRLAEHIRSVVDAAPPLTAEQRDRLRVLLAPSADQGGGQAA